MLSITSLLRNIISVTLYTLSYVVVCASTTNLNTMVKYSQVVYGLDFTIITKIRLLIGWKENLKWSSMIFLRERKVIWREVAARTLQCLFRQHINCFFSYLFKIRLEMTWLTRRKLIVKSKLHKHINSYCIFCY